MKPGLLILPFLAVFVTAIGAAIGSTFPETKWLSYVGLALGSSITFLWILLDIQGFKGLFQRKGAKYGASSGAVVILAVAVISGIAVLGARPRFNKSLDLTRDKVNTLSEQSLQVVRNLRDSKSPIKITTFLIDEKIQTEFRDLIKLYQSQGADFTIESVDPRIDPTRATADKITEGNTVIFRLGTQEKRLTTFSEEKITNTLINLLKGTTKNIYFTKGHGEGPIKGTEAFGFSTVTTELEQNKYLVRDLGILESGKIPDDADAVIIAGPKYDFKAEETAALEDYLKKGGALLVMVSTAVPVPLLNQLIEKFGVGFNSDYLVMPPELSQTRAYAPNSVLITEFDSLSPITRDFSSQSAVAIQSKNTRSLTEFKGNPNKTKVTLVAKTHSAMYAVSGVKVPEDLNGVTEERLSQGAKVVIAVASGLSSKDQASTSETDQTKVDAKLSKKARETRLIVAGSNFASNDATYLGEARDLFLNMTSYLLQDEDFIAIRPKDPTKSYLDVASSRATFSLLILSWVYPFLFLGFGTYGWLKRRRA